MFVLSPLTFRPIGKGRIVIIGRDVTMCVVPTIQGETSIILLSARFMDIPEKANIRQQRFAFRIQRGMQPGVFPFLLMPLFADPLTFVFVCI